MGARLARSITVTVARSIDFNPMRGLCPTLLALCGEFVTSTILPASLSVLVSDFEFL
jgi:hypothetical protein